MILTNIYKGHAGVEYMFEYQDADSFEHLDKSRCKQTYGVCFCDDKIVFGYSRGRKEYGLIGGTIEEGESFEQSLRREIKEESNMEVLSYLPIGYQKVTDSIGSEPFYQLRYACLVKPYGPFLGDPMGDIVEIKLVDPLEVKQYFDWGNIGDRIIERAIELKNNL